ncbi:hypothetical protein JOF56_005086 [Kibdelosporangium banguiense]|uniref:Peptidase inhibitor family I36 n=1 Tax=Kibdelosporangium banguiense TaxID=1365924 RepID=A0ABS4TLF1_9PSEU|nr:peptidase inhibitor family I36 protein [Kibdelosporangium banguiense]MBP2324701.1 hypothetical protein [Kibdelosporangium banguiense]
MRITRLAVGLLAMLAAFVMVTGSAHAAMPKPVEFVPADVSTMAWECASGNFCAWTGLDGKGSRCSWSDADPDWLSGTVRCSWAGSQKVQSYLNNGTSSRFTGVEIYLNPNYVTKFHCVLQGGQGWNVTEGGVFLRSHRWISAPCF